VTRLARVPALVVEPEHVVYRHLGGDARAVGVRVTSELTDADTHPLASFVFFLMRRPEPGTVLSIPRVEHVLA